jgi:hypothetical protein
VTQGIAEEELMSREVKQLHGDTQEEQIKNGLRSKCYRIADN